MSSQPFATPAVLLFIAAIPLVFGLVPPNRFYGVRTAKTLSNSALWYRVNRFAAVGMIICSGLYGMVAALVPYQRQAADNFSVWGIHLAAFVLPLIVCLSLARRYAKRL